MRTMSAIRDGNFSSSEVVALAKEGDAYDTYIEECNMERRLQTTLEEEVNSRSLCWGKFVERIAFNELGMEYTLSSQETIPHPTINCWVGSPDGTKIDTVIDIKCPTSRKSFCQLVDPLYMGMTGAEAMNAIRFGFKDKEGKKHKKHRDGEKFYFQLVSNAILTNKEYAELIVYMPYQSELDHIRHETANAEDDLQNKLAWINFATDDELPHLIDGGYYKNINVIRFKVPQEDKDLLTERVEQASKLLITI